MTFGVIITEAEVRDVVHYSNAMLLEAYRRGLKIGADLHGAGSCDLWTETDLHSTDAEALTEEVRQLALKKIRDAAREAMTKQRW